MDALLGANESGPMSLLNIAMLGTVISLALSAILSWVILPPVRSVLRRGCPTDDGVSFWTRFTILMLFLGPLIVTLVFGVPPSRVAERLTTEDQILRVATASLVGVFLALTAIGIRMGTLRQPAPPPPAVARRTDDQLIR